MTKIDFAGRVPADERLQGVIDAAVDSLTAEKGASKGAGARVSKMSHLLWTVWRVCGAKVHAGAPVPLTLPDFRNAVDPDAAGGAQLRSLIRRHTLDKRHGAGRDAWNIPQSAAIGMAHLCRFFMSVHRVAADDFPAALRTADVFRAAEVDLRKSKAAWPPEYSEYPPGLVGRSPQIEMFPGHDPRRKAD